MKLTYWMAPCKGDSFCYNIRTKTKREAKDALSSFGSTDYGKIRKHTIEYDSAFDLMAQCLSESHGYEPSADYDE